MNEPEAAIIIGVDCHKKMQVCVAINRQGRALAETIVDATDTGHAKALRWAQTKFGRQPTMWAIEDVRVLSRRLEFHLLDHGQVVVRVPTKLMARTRNSSQERGKSDRLDATCAAMAAIRYPQLQRAHHDQTSYELKLLVDRRRTLVEDRASQISRIRWRIHEIDPEFRCGPYLTCDKHRVHLRDFLLTQQPTVLTRITLAEVEDLARLTREIRELEKEIRARITAIAPNTLAVPGCGYLSAARLVAEAANVTRFRTEAQFAMHVGLAPIPHYSANQPRFRAGHSGHRAMRSAIHKVAVAQIRSSGVGRPYYDRRLESGDNKPAALRALRRKITRVLFNALRRDYLLRTVGQPTGVPVASG
ncbi:MULTISPECIES: IS110 family transposase [unclassified Mycolicibacterium]|uniref:Transposase IS116/IS110/IS902 family protein n=3 Tax=Mycolicibacterium TaxID=1866885 RepID=A0A1S6GKX9_9MYCO|nr:MULTISPECIES: IS110 family transposase [unclassified Mycolicibacterium]AQS22518.1 Transposase IS116/IS110/IS902 family protein [Mycolicibacterium sp. CBMA 213]